MNHCKRRTIRSRSVRSVEMLEARMLLTAVVVNTVVDAIYPNGSGMVSLRNAVVDANSSTSPTTITFDPAVFASAQEIVMNGDVLELSNTSEPTTITGPSAGVTLYAGDQSSVFSVDAGVTASISGITASNASTGAINNDGTLTLADSTVENSTNSVSGGGLYNNGTATLDDDTFTGNNTEVGAGAVNDGTITVTGCTFFDNATTGETNVYDSAGAGVYDNGTGTFINDTFTGNSGADGVGVYDYGGVVTVSDSTISGNTGNGIFKKYSTFTVVNTIVTGNIGSGDANGSFNSLGFNIIGDDQNSSGWNSDDHVGTSSSPLSADLGALVNNGGPTQTMLPTAGSPALDAGSVSFVPSGTTTDQRGDARIVDGTVDTGSVETQKTITLTAPEAQSAVPNAAQAIGLGSFTQSGTLGPYTVTVNWGDGSANTTFTQSAAGTIETQTHTFTSIATDTVTVTVKDTTGDFSGSTSFSVSVAPAPVITVTAPAAQSVLVDTSESFSLGSFTQYSTSGPYAVDVNWGDSTADTTFSENAAGSIFNQSHTFLGSGNYAVVVKVTDSTGAISSDASFVVAVTTGSTPSSIALQASSGSIYSTAPITLTAHVTPATATGVVTFLQNGAVLQQAAISNGVATVTTTSLSIGTGSITATYGGSSTYAASNSASVSVTVQTPPNTTTLSLQTAASAVSTSDSVTLTATVSPASIGSTVATGSVTFYQATTVLAVVTLGSNGTATYATTSALPVGSDSFTAVYTGDTNFTPSTASATVVMVSPTATVTSLDLSSASKTLAQAVIFTATVSPGSTDSTTLTDAVDSGTVTFSSDGTVIGTADVGTGGVATLTAVTDLPLGLDPVTADFNGTSSFESSEAPTDNIAVTADALVPTILRVRLPAAAVGGVAVHGASITTKLTNDLTNTEAGYENGIFYVRIYASATTTFDPTLDTVVATVHKKAKIKESKSVNVGVPISSFPVSLGSGTYHLLLVSTDSYGNTEEIDTGAVVNVAAPVITLAATITSVPKNAVTSGVIVMLSNTGNVNDSSAFTATIGVSTDPAGQNLVASGSGVMTHGKILIRPGHLARIHVSGWKSLFASLPAGPYYLTATLSDSTNHIASAVTAELQT